MLPSIFNNNLFDDFFGFPFYYDNRAEDKAEKKLYGHHAGNLMKIRKTRRQASTSDVSVMQAHVREAIMLAKISQKRISRHPLNMVF